MAGDGIVRAAVIGAGTFGNGIVAQAVHAPRLRVCAVADANLAVARRAYEQAGAAAQQIVACDSAQGARRALQAARVVVTTDPSILFDQPLDVIVESTGVAEAAARHARGAIAHGKHVAMVTKEADAAVGPILRHRADRAGVTYTPVDGDQHGLLIRLVAWARDTGLDIVCGGKALDTELVVDPAARAVQHGRRRIDLLPVDVEAFEPADPSNIAAAVAARAKAIGDVRGAKPWDLVELVIAANATGLDLDTPATHCPPVHTTEILVALSPRTRGGLLSRDVGAIDAVQLVRHPREAGLYGGVFVVVRGRSAHVREILTRKGAMCHPDGSTALVLHPHHLMGIEAVGSIIAAATSRGLAGAVVYRPRYDVIYRAASPLRVGQTVGNDHSPDLYAEILPARALAPDAPLPAGLATGNRLLRDVSVGNALTGADVARPADSVLWALRDEQDVHVFPST